MQQLAFEPRTLWPTYSVLYTILPARLCQNPSTHPTLKPYLFLICATGKRDLQFEKVISDVTADLKLTRDDDFTLRVVQLSELLAIRHCVFLMGPTGSGRSEVYKVGHACMY